MVNLTIGRASMHKCTITDEKMLDIYKRIGQNVKKIRKEKGVTQLQLSLAIGHKAVGTVSMGEICLNKKHFNIEHLMKIGEVLGVDVCEFFKEE
jgi:transcriptional regulator with XRE-family HTH domain